MPFGRLAAYFTFNANFIKTNGIPAIIHIILNFTATAMAVWLLVLVTSSSPDTTIIIVLHTPAWDKGSVQLSSPYPYIVSILCCSCRRSISHSTFNIKFLYTIHILQYTTFTYTHFHGVNCKHAIE